MPDDADMTATLPIPPLETATDPVRSPADIGQRWRALMGPLAFASPLLQFVFVGPDRCLVTVLTEVEVDPTPDPAYVARLMAIIAELLEDGPPGTTVAFLLTRPGRDRVSATDRSWAAVINEEAAKLGIPVEPFFRANDDAVTEVPPA
ncbi:hypothetical protein MYFR107205_06010 [Mycolicibacterium frederiksbergense]